MLKMKKQTGLRSREKTSDVLECQFPIAGFLPTFWGHEFQNFFGPSECRLPKFFEGIGTHSWCSWYVVPLFCQNYFYSKFGIFRQFFQIEKAQIRKTIRDFKKYALFIFFFVCRWADSIVVDGVLFDHPYFQAFCMFIGEFSCLVVFVVAYLVKKRRWKNRKLVEIQDKKKTNFFNRNVMERKEQKKKNFVGSHEVGGGDEREFQGMEGKYVSGTVPIREIFCKIWVRYDLEGIPIRKIENFLTKCYLFFRHWEGNARLWN